MEYDYLGAMEPLKVTLTELKASSGRCMAGQALNYCVERLSCLKPGDVSPNVTKNQHRPDYPVDEETGEIHFDEDSIRNDFEQKLQELLKINSNK